MKTRMNSKNFNILSFLHQHDLIYEDAPQKWEQGLPFGNGSIGALIWGDGDPLNLTIDSYELWDLREPFFEDPNYSYARFKELYRNGKAKEILDMRQVHLANITPTRLPALRLEMKFGSRVKKFNARLNLATATASGRIVLNHGSVRWDAYVSAEKDIFVINTQTAGNLRTDVNVSVDHLQQKAVAELKRRGFSSPKTGKTLDISWLYQVIPENGAYLLAWKKVSKKYNKETILVTLIKGEDNKESLIKKASERLADVSMIRKQHKQWWAEFWNKSFISIPDASLESLFYAEMYKLGSCCRSGKFLVTLQGVWSKDDEMPPWNGDYHLDLQPQQCSLPVYATNHLECAEPLYAWAERLVPRFKHECQKFFGCDGIFVPCALGLNGERIYGYTTTDTWPGMGPWLSFHFWLHYLYTHDEEFLKSRAYPFMRLAMQLYAGILEKREDGLYHIPLSTSPESYEYGYQAWGTDTTCDLFLIRFLASTLLKCVEQFSIHEPETEKWTDILNHLAPYPTRQNMSQGLDEQWFKEHHLKWLPDTDYAPRSLCIMKDVPYSFSHRHMTHLMGIYPLGILTIEDSEDAKSTIYDSIKQLWLFGSGKWWGWTLSWVSLIASRARMPEMAYRMLHEYVSNFISSNTFNLNGDFRFSGVSFDNRQVMTLEGGFGAAAAIVEMLLQSWGGKIRVFPSIPSKWKESIFYNLRAEGAFLVSANLRDGKLQWVEVYSEKGITCQLNNSFCCEQVKIEDIKNKKVKKIKGKLLKFSTLAGHTYRIYCCQI